MSKPGKDKHESIFEILDGMMFQLSKTKKIFMIMILTTLIIPPVALVAITTALDSPFNDRLERIIEQRINDRCRQDQLTKNECDNLKNRLIDNNRNKVLLQPAQLVILAISVVWLGIGIKQWLSISKWDKKYQKFKERQERIDKKLDDFFEE